MRVTGAPECGWAGRLCGFDFFILMCGEAVRDGGKRGQAAQDVAGPGVCPRMEVVSVVTRN